jgi:xanthine dehydrogenase accessory factor
MRVLEAAWRASRDGRPAALVTVIEANGSTPRSSGARMLVCADGVVVGTIGGGTFEHRVLAAARAAIESGRPTRFAVDLVRDVGMCCGGRMEVYIEPLEVQTPFVLFGAGHVAHALAPLLAGLPLDVVVVDARDDWLTEERFPRARREVRDPREWLATYDLDPRSLVLVVTHDHAIDQDLVEALLPGPAAWVGMIGSRAKAARFRTRLRAAGLREDQVDRLRTPVGLDIGAETPAEIAISIAAEVVQVLRRPTTG